ICTSNRNSSSCRCSCSNSRRSNNASSSGNSSYICSSKRCSRGSCNGFSSSSLFSSVLLHTSLTLWSREVCRLFAQPSGLSAAAAVCCCCCCCCFCTLAALSPLNQEISFEQSLLIGQPLEGHTVMGLSGVAELLLL